MKTSSIAILAVLALGCSKKQADGDCCAPEAPAAAPAHPEASRAGGVVLTGLPGDTDLAVCDAQGRWGLKTPQVEHSIADPRAKGPLLPAESHPTLTLFRDSIPFPQLNWKSGDWEVTQLVFPVGKGFVARYHVMNHGDLPCQGTLAVGAPGSAGPLLASAGQAPAPRLEFKLQIEPGVSEFFFVTTPDLAGKVPEDALDQAAAQWEKLLGKRALKLPDPHAVTDYYADLAGQVLGVPGCAEAAAKIEAMLVKKEGDALALLPGIPEAWRLESIEAKEIPTPYGPLSFRYQGEYDNRIFELLPGASPPGGYRVELPPNLVARIDGKAVSATAGVIQVPPGSRTVELFHPR